VHEKLRTECDRGWKVLLEMKQGLKGSDLRVRLEQKTTIDHTSALDKRVSNLERESANRTTTEAYGRFEQQRGQGYKQHE
jgi:hypothetical protein